MNVASRELCQELYELSGWRERNGQVWMKGYSTSELGAGHEDYGKAGVVQHQVNVRDWEVTADPLHRLGVPERVFHWSYREIKELEAEAIPAYDLGYLLRKLSGEAEVGVKWLKTGFYLAKTGYEYSFKRATADTPENAACSLAIARFKAGHLTQGENHE